MAERQFSKGVTRARSIMPRARQSLFWAVSACVVSVAFFTGCQRSSPDNRSNVSSSGNHPPTVRAVTIQPVPLVLTSPVTAHVEAQDIDRNSLRFRYQWSVNGKAIPGQDNEQLPAAILKRGDRVSVQVWPHDGTVEGDSKTSESVIVGNSPPMGEALEIEPPYVFPGVRVRARAKLSDIDGDAIQVVYRWLKNGKLIHEGEESEFETVGFVLGDTLAVEAVPSDGTSKGPVLRLGPISVGNTPPRIVSNPATTIVNNRYDYRVQATDAESDAIVFSLETAPPGMQIDAQTGVVTWVVESPQVGAHKVRIVAKDTQGGVAFQEFELNLTTTVTPAEPAGT